MWYVFSCQSALINEMINERHNDNSAHRRLRQKKEWGKRSGIKAWERRNDAMCECRAHNKYCKKGKKIKQEITLFRAETHHRQLYWHTCANFLLTRTHKEEQQQRLVHSSTYSKYLNANRTNTSTFRFVFLHLLISLAGSNEVNTLDSDRKRRSRL